MVQTISKKVFQFLILHLRNAPASLPGQGVEALYPDFFFRDVVANDPVPSELFAKPRDGPKKIYLSNPLGPSFF